MILQGYKFVYKLSRNTIDIQRPKINLAIFIEAVKENYCAYPMAEKIIKAYLNSIDFNEHKAVSDIGLEIFTSLSKVMIWNGFDLIKLEVSTENEQPIKITKESLTPKSRAELHNFLKHTEKVLQPQAPLPKIINPIQKSRKRDKGKSKIIILAVPVAMSLLGILIYVLN